MHVLCNHMLRSSYLLPMTMLHTQSNNIQRKCCKRHLFTWCMARFDMRSCLCAASQWKLCSRVQCGCVRSQLLHRCLQIQVIQWGPCSCHWAVTNSRWSAVMWARWLCQATSISVIAIMMYKDPLGVIIWICQHYLAPFLI